MKYLNENRKKYPRVKNRPSQEMVFNLRTWNDIKHIKHLYRIGCDRDWLREKYPDIAHHIELEDFAFRLKTLKSKSKLFGFESLYAQQMAQILSE